LMPSSKSKWKIQIKYSRGTRPKLEVRPWGVVVILPEGMNKNKAYRIIEKHRLWIEEKHADLLTALEHSRNVELVKRSEAEFRNLVEKLVEQAANDILGMNPCRVVIRKMKTRWASCSPKGTITINKLARFLPDHLISYIVYHEICHIIDPKHDKSFRTCIQKYYPNYKELERRLLIYEVKLGLHEFR